MENCQNAKSFGKNGCGTDFILGYFSESGQNETFVENETLVPHLFSDICIYSGSHRRLIGQKPNENFLTRFFSEKTCILNPMTPSHMLNTMHYGIRAMGAMSFRISELCLSFSPHPNISDGNFNLDHHFFRMQIFQLSLEQMKKKEKVKVK